MKTKTSLSFPFLLLLCFGGLLFFSSALSNNFNSLKESTTSDTTKKEENYLEIKGSVRQTRGKEKTDTKPIDSALISIYYSDHVFTKIWTNKKGKCAFRLPLNEDYRIEISKEGFTTKYFEVNAKLPHGKKGIFYFDFDLDLFIKIAKLDISVLKKPIARVTFNKVSNQFTYDAAYTNRINLDLKKMYRDYYLFQKIDIDFQDVIPQGISNPTPVDKK
jgi:hypothetical protein